ncbi:hypothetical protein EV191_101182 [Tamaricihabitans halophyticus]|uniref:Uncharacterized protein n=1 Tax=Tamaricihabitans halophyticus TaxID=1262583 RepID=A0A4R2R0R5_9PSEU|nr:hypothetical protein [Tamaricihabitans halophyticus]TCP56242.1 hypothetical protein EV191_101182 [Tamaricihabitans halophyticus]
MTVGERRALLAILCVDAALLAIVELFYLPLRLDGTVLPDLGGAPFPISAVLALVTTPLLVSQAARVGAKASIAGAPLFVWFVVLLIFGVFGPGGDNLLIPDWRTLLLLACGALPSAIVLGGALGRGLGSPGQQAARMPSAR